MLNLMRSIPYGKQSISENDVASVVEVLQSPWLTQGPAIERFEAALMEATNARFAIALSSATAALHLACLALGAGKGDRVWTSPNSFVASSNCALYCGATVDFVDIDPVTLNMCVVKLEEKLIHASQTGLLPKIVIPVHFAGEPCDMAKIGALAKRFDFKVIEDASHAIGGRYHDEAIGACAHSDITVFSFHPVKIVTTGEGGAALTQDANIAKSIARLRTHGISRDVQDMTKSHEGAWYYEQIDLGLNYRMTDIQAALGASQITRLDEFVAKRHSIANRYDELLQALPVKIPIRASTSLSGLHLYPIQIDDASRRKAVFDGMRLAEIGVNVHYIPIHTQPYYSTLGFRLGDFPAAEEYYSRAISLPMFPTLDIEEQDYVISSLAKLLS